MRMRLGSMQKSRTMRVTLLMMLGSVLLTSCGYHTSTKASQIPPDVHTIAIPAFINKTESYRVEQVITQAVVQEMITRTEYRVVTAEDPTADATLRGTVTQAELSPLTYDSQTGRASSAIVVVHVNWALLDSRGKTLYAEPDFVFRDQYQVSREISSFFAEDAPAVRRLSRDLAHSLVADLLEGY
jgi:outer membrane lipopolysaccharide assembly protein LptE/RlpB